MAKALPAHQKQEGLFVCRASSRPHGGGRLLSAAAIAAVAASAIVVAVKAEPVAAAAAQQNEDDDEPSAVSVTHGKASFQVTLYLMAYGEKCYSLHFLPKRNFEN